MEKMPPIATAPSTRYAMEPLISVDGMPMVSNFNYTINLQVTMALSLLFHHSWRDPGSLHCSTRTLSANPRMVWRSRYYKSLKFVYWCMLFICLNECINIYIFWTAVVAQTPDSHDPGHQIQSENLSLPGLRARLRLLPPRSLGRAAGLSRLESSASSRGLTETWREEEQRREGRKARGLSKPEDFKFIVFLCSWC
jgi:hypothetical protein